MTLLNYKANVLERVVQKMYSIIVSEIKLECM